LDIARDAPLIASLVALFGAAVVLAASEASLLRVSRVKVTLAAERGDPAARRLQGLLEDFPRVLNAVLLSVLLVQIATASITSLLADRWFGTTGVTVATFVLTLFLFVYAEAIPKTFAVRQPERVALAVSGVLSLLSAGLGPFVSVLVWFADLQAPGEGIASMAVSAEELVRMAEEAVSEGSLEENDAALLERSFEFRHIELEDILVPRVDVRAVGVDEPVAGALEVALEAGHRRLAVHDGSLDELVGVVRLRDLAAAVAAGEPTEVRSLIRPILVVPETVRIQDLLREMQRTGRHFAVAVDEHGGTAGIATIEDVVEELVGEISEDLPNVPAIQACDPDRWLVDAAADADELAEQLGLELPPGDYRSVGGAVMQLTGRLPALDETVTVDGFRIRVVARGRQRIHRLEVRRERDEDRAPDGPGARS
jgi:putative hemolysin